jgi:hypothetical protein
VGREIKLSGGEITMLKALGLAGTPVHGKQLIDRVGMESAELLDTLDGLTTMGYVLSSKVNIQNMEDVERGYFRVNASFSRELRDALRPGRRKEEEERPRRRPSR